MESRHRRTYVDSLYSLAETGTVKKVGATPIAAEPGNRKSSLMRVSAYYVNRIVEVIGLLIIPLGLRSFSSQYSSLVLASAQV